MKSELDLLLGSLLRALLGAMDGMFANKDRRKSSDRNGRFGAEEEVH